MGGGHFGGDLKVDTFRSTVISAFVDRVTLNRLKGFMPIAENAEVKLGNAGMVRT